MNEDRFRTLTDALKVIAGISAVIAAVAVVMMCVVIIAHSDNIEEYQRNCVKYHAPIECINAEKSLTE